MLYKSVGILRYFHNGNYKLIVEIDQALVNYYRSLIPKYINFQNSKYRAHISVVRREIPNNLEYWNKYEGNKVIFYYNPSINIGQKYIWLNVICSKLNIIRKELGLPINRGSYKYFHFTIGNMK